MRLVIGLIKGLVIGGLVGLGAYKLGMTGGFHYLTYGLIGLLVGLLVGRPIWTHLSDKDSTVWVSVLKSIVGYLIGIGLFALIGKAIGPDITLQGETRPMMDWQPLLGAIIGGIYGAWVEADDAAPSGDKKQ